MWALGRAANPLRSQGCHVGAFRACCTKFIVQSDYIENAVGITEPAELVAGAPLLPKRLYHSPSIHVYLHPGSRSLSSQAGAKSSGDEEELEDGFSELETPASIDSIEESNTGEEIDEELVSGPDLSDIDSVESLAEASQNELDLSDAEAGATDEESKKKRFPLDLFRAIMNAPHVGSALDKWVAEGNRLGRSEISVCMINLRKRRMYGRALQISEWLEKNKQIKFVERDYASHLDLIAKVRGLQKAEQYIGKIPESFRGEIIYRTLLANCVVATNVKKAEEVFNKMRDLDFPITTFACNQLLLLYKRFDKKKIADVLLLMEKENAKPTLFTYRLLIDTKGQSNDITGMEQVLETMKAERIEPDIFTQFVLSKHYINAGLNEKAEGVLKEMEGCSLVENRGACRNLLPLYAALGKADDVKRVWKACEPKPQLEECVAAIEAWGKLGKIEEAEAVFEKMCKTWKKLPTKNYTALLRVYADHKLLSKGKDLAKRMADSGCRIGPLTWDGLVKLYVEAGDVEKADSILQKAVQQSSLKPMFNSYMVIMDQYAKRGDVHNAEKMFHRLKLAGYAGRIRQYQTLLQAYVNAKTPAYGFRDRMKADNIFPNKAVAAQLAQVDAFKKTAISDLLD
ncbi:pentatricopeptide repeat-containing protein At1g80270, mitochondrial-like isoform X2 [Telopea speciosissima]|uniref:pentatricopeptide repeat-containing protein At1g80270, mitochondrial-like isoform X2 n=1 Tax=Telopea speciosissima TaxID=54955 RepID=UPI001CC70653|nr:pentatricopeptide repeat-containing protein At1g80270, mitochondrial-like isoform X2 [Telopea speciosissima]